MKLNDNIRDLFKRVSLPNLKIEKGNQSIEPGDIPTVVDGRVKLLHEYSFWFSIIPSPSFSEALQK